MCEVSNFWYTFESQTMSITIFISYLYIYKCIPTKFHGRVRHLNFTCSFKSPMLWDKMRSYPQASVFLCSVSMEFAKRTCMLLQLLLSLVQIQSGCIRFSCALVPLSSTNLIEVARITRFPRNMCALVTLLSTNSIEVGCVTRFSRSMSHEQYALHAPNSYVLSEIHEALLYC